jgi:hypothetical protein
VLAGRICATLQPATLQRGGTVARLRRLDWDAVAGIVAAVVALVLHLLHIVDEETLLAIVLVILALMLLRDLRREEREERAAEAVVRADQGIQALRAGLTPPDTVLVGPDRLRAESERFARQAAGDMVWFNVCLLMFVPQALFDVLLRPAIENPHVGSIQFLLDHRERERWEQAVMPKLAACAGREKVREPLWSDLRESVSFILAQSGPGGGTEAHLSFWGEPFMAHTTGQAVPRYIFHVQPHSELIGRLVELERTYRLSASHPARAARSPQRGGAAT